MQRVLNTRTKTAHKPPDGGSQVTACGSLRHTSPARIRTVPVDEVDSSDAVTRCGSCFEDAGGY